MSDELRRMLQAELGPRYEVGDELGRGGMGVVFLGLDTALGRRVAIKVIRPDRCTAAYIARFEREARALAGIESPNVVRVYDVPAVRQVPPVMIMELVEGRTLQVALATNGPFPPARVRMIGRQLLEALGTVHANGIVHRDVKPGNIVLMGDVAKLMDFGIAVHEGDETLTREDQRPGSPDYMAPEQRAGRPATPRSDIYSLGLVLSEALLGRRPQVGDERAWQSIPRDLRRVLRRALETEPADRWPDARSFRRALAATGRPWTRVLGGRAALGIVALGTLAFGALVLWRTLGLPCETADPPPPATAPFQLAILPFAAAGDDALGTRVARLATTELEGFPRVHVAPSAATLAWLERRPADDSASSLPFAQRLAVGSLERRGDTLRVVMEVRESADQRLYARFTTTRIAPDPGALAHELADSLVRKLSGHDLQDFRNASYRPVDVQAMSAFFAGQDAFQRGDWAAAEARYDESLHLDPQFVNAAWALMIVRRFQRKPFGDALDVLLREREALSPFYRELLDAQLEPDLVQRMRRYEQLVRTSEGGPEALLHYTNELFHRGALVGRSLPATLDTMSLLAVEGRDLRHAATYDLTIWGNLRVGRESVAIEQFRRRCALVRDPDPRADLHRFAIWARFSPWKAALVRTFAFRSDSSVLAELSQVARLGLSMDIPEEQVAIGRLLERRGGARPDRVTGTVAQALGLVALGRPAAGLAQLDTAAARLASSEMRLQQEEWPVALAALGLPIDPTRVARARDALRADTWQGPAHARARFVLGLDALSRRDTAAARAIADSLSAAAEPIATRLGALLEAQLLGAQGEWLEALTRSRPVFVLDSASYHMGPFARSATYLARGEWQVRLGHWRDADAEWLWYENADFLGWPRAEPQQGEVDAMLAGLGRLRRAELAVSHLEPTATCEPLARVRELWARSEPAWRPLVQRVDSTRERAGCR